MPKAGWGSRLLALVVDGLAMILLLVPTIVIFAAGPREDGTCTVETNWGTRTETYTEPCEVPAPATIGLGLLAGVGSLAGIVAYWAVYEGKRTQTWGKKALGIRTVDAQTGGPLGPGRAVGRYFARFLSGLPCYLGYLWPLWDQHSQAFHDKMVNSVVVKA